VKDFKERTIRGGLARICAQGMEFLLRLAGLMVLARLLTPTDFGIVGMVTAFTGFLTLFRDFGLSYRRNRRIIGGISFQRGRGAARRSSSTRNAFYDRGAD